MCQKMPDLKALQPCHTGKIHGWWRFFILSSMFDPCCGSAGTAPRRPNRDHLAIAIALGGVLICSDCGAAVSAALGTGELGQARRLRHKLGRHLALRRLESPRGGRYDAALFF
jgi:hypothetical protein